LNRIEAWPRESIVRVFSREKVLIDEIEGGKVNLYEQVCSWVDEYGEEIFVSMRLKDHDEVYWTPILIDDVETLIIDDFKEDDVHVQPEIIFGEGFPLSSEAVWKVFVAATAEK
jgi:hypothetical protein